MAHAGVQGVWAVRFWPEGLDWEPAFSNHAFLLMGLWAGTKVLLCCMTQAPSKHDLVLGLVDQAILGLDTWAVQVGLHHRMLPKCCTAAGTACLWRPTSCSLL